MKWIRDEVEYLRNNELLVADPEAEKQKALNRVKNFHPVGNQFVYAMTYFAENLLYLSNGVEEVLGFSSNEISDISFFYDRIHPDDIESVKNLTTLAISAGAGIYGIEPLQQVFHITYRIKHRDGHYISVQRQTGMLTKDQNENMLTSFGIFTDVTHLTNSEEVQALMSGPEIPNYNFNITDSESKPVFTKREKEIIKLLATGLNSKEIGEKLFIAKNTVDTHRRNILRKTGVSNSTELIAYIFKNGY